jgi:hypothetical protein
MMSVMVQDGYVWIRFTTLTMVDAMYQLETAQGTPGSSNYVLGTIMGKLLAKNYMCMLYCN